MFYINSLGCEKDKTAIKGRLKKELKENISKLCQDCIGRYDTNILRILDCKVESCKKIIDAVSLDNMLCDKCKDDFMQLTALLERANIKFKINPKLVRGLDYYTGIVFEVNSSALGAQDAVAAGGRYDNLISDLGGNPQGATGFSIGMERIVNAIKDKDGQAGIVNEHGSVFIVALGEMAYRKGFEILSELRRLCLPSDIDYQQKSFKAQMRYADKIGAGHVVILGENELKKGTCILKDMKKGAQEDVPLDDLIHIIKEMVLSSRIF
jgi:histidyl-tRNA synthetase